MKNPGVSPYFNTLQGNRRRETFFMVVDERDNEVFCADTFSEAEEFISNNKGEFEIFPGMIRR